MDAVRFEQAADDAAIDALLRGAFPTDGEARLVRALRRAERLTLSLVAVHGERVVGHVAFSPVRIGGTDAVGLGLAPVAVLAEFRRRGRAAELIRRGLAGARDLGCGFVVVLGDPGYYGRFGFRPAADRGLKDEYGGGEAFQVLELQPGALPPEGGLVRYADEFAAL